jgi:hypothetical protein
MQLLYDYNHNVMLMLFLIHSLEFIMWHYEDFWVICFEILISIIHYDYSFKMVFNYDMWHNQKLPHGKLVEF